MDKEEVTATSTFTGAAGATIFSSIPTGLGTGTEVDAEETTESVELALTPDGLVVIGALEGEEEEGGRAAIVDEKRGEGETEN